MRIVNTVLSLNLALLVLAGCSSSVEELPKYRQIDLGRMSSTHEVITMSTFDDIAKEGIYGVRDGVGGQKHWGSIEKLHEKLLAIASGDKPVAIVGRFNNSERVDLLDYPITHYNRNCWHEPERSFPVAFFTKYEWSEGSWKEPTLEEKKAWGQFEAVVTGVLIENELDAVGAKDACDHGGHVSVWVHVHEVYNKTTGKRVWPTAEES